MCACVCVLPVGKEFAAVVNADRQKLFCDLFTIMGPTEMLHAKNYTKIKVDAPFILRLDF